MVYRHHEPSSQTRKYPLTTPEYDMDQKDITELAAKAISAKCRDRDSYATLRMTEQLIHVLPECPEKSALVNALATGTSTNETDYMSLLSALNRAIGS